MYQYWGTPGSMTHVYNYAYDKLNRLQYGVMELTPSGTILNAEQGIKYDQMGNITQLVRTSTGTTQIDNLAYTYTGNQLQSVYDNTGSNSGMVAGTTSYTYDGNGNMLTQTNTTNTGSNKTFTYNLLNLPQTAVVPTGTLTYTYDATGNKLRRTSTGLNNTTDYISGIQYDGATTPALSFIQTEEGKAVPNGTGYDYVYYLGDNLGNTRVTFGTKTGAAVSYQNDDYYPFGLEINNSVLSPKNEYLYNKKELQEETQEYDYGARFYDPVIGRMTTIDRFAEKYMSHTPYHYAADNPISVIDLNGDSIIQVFSSNFNGPANPTKLSDLGRTGLSGDVGITGTPTIDNVNVAIPISTTYSAAFQGSNNIEQQNPGLQNEVKTHEDVHVNQIMAAANKDVSVSSKIDGVKVSFSGTADKVIVQVQKAVNASSLSPEAKGKLIDKLGTKALTQMNNNINKVLKDPKSETAAINQTAANPANQYSNGKPVVYNGKTLKNDQQ